MDKWFKLVVSIAALIAGVSIAHYFLFFLPTQATNQKIHRLTIECRQLGEKMEREVNPPDIAFMGGQRPVEPEFYYNPSLKKCLYCGGRDGAKEENRVIIDVYTNKTLAQYFVPYGFTKGKLDAYLEEKAAFQKDKAKLFEGNAFTSELDRRSMQRREEHLKKIKAAQAKTDRLLKIVEENERK